jgi:hypothetical protein
MNDDDYRRTAKGDRFYAALMTAGMDDPEVREVVEDMHRDCWWCTSEELLESLRRVMQRFRSVNGES